MYEKTLDDISSGVTSFIPPLAQLELNRVVVRPKSRKEFYRVRHSSGHGSNASIISTQSGSIGLNSNPYLVADTQLVPPSNSSILSAGIGLKEAIRLPTYMNRDTKPSAMLDEMIHKCHLITEMDLYHGPARMQLAYLHYLEENYVQSMYHLEQLMESRQRGSGSGLPGTFGGFSSSWGWGALQLMGEIYKKQGLEEKAMDFFIQALDQKRRSTVRGLESLRL